MNLSDLKARAEAASERTGGNVAVLRIKPNTILRLIAVAEAASDIEYLLLGLRAEYGNDDIEPLLAALRDLEETP